VIPCPKFNASGSARINPIVTDALSLDGRSTSGIERVSLGGEKRDGCTQTTFSTNNFSLGTGAQAFACTPSFTLVTMLGDIDKVLTFKEQLLPGSKDKFFTTGNTLEFSVYKKIGQNDPGSTRDVS
jgi:hypothetical protein